MTTYNTGNPVGSTDVRDLYDNAQNLDSLVNGPLTSYADRLGAPRKSWRGLEQDFSAFLAASGFELPALEYVGGTPLVVDRPTQLIFRTGFPDTLYGVKSTEPFPATLSGTWSTDEVRLVVRSDRDLRQDLANSTDPAKGAGLVGYRGQTAAQHLDGVILSETEGLVGDDSKNDNTKLVALLSRANALGAPVVFKDGVYRIEQGGNVAKPADEVSPLQLVRKRYVDLRTGIYEPSDIPSWNPFQPWATQNMDSLTYATLTNMWGALVAAHPTRFFAGSDFGVDQSGVYPIKQYVFLPAQTPGYRNGANREMLVYAGIHGGELVSMLALYYFVKDLLERGQTDPSLQSVYRHVRLRIIPCVNPWGMSQSPRTRGNSRGVDLNRNGDFYWDEYVDGGPGSADYKGTAPWSEAETQALKSMLDQYGSAAFCVVDLHNFGAGTQPAPHYTGFCSPLGYPVMAELAAELCRTGERFNAYQLQMNPSPIHYASRRFGIPALNPEHTDDAWGRSSFYDANRGTKESLMGATRWYGNLILRFSARFGDRLPTPVVRSRVARGGTENDKVLSGSTAYVVADNIRSIPHGIEGIFKARFYVTVHNTSAGAVMVFIRPMIASIQMNEFEQYQTVPPGSRATLATEGLLYQPRSARNVAVALEIKVIDQATLGAGTVTLKRCAMICESVASNIDSVSYLLT